MYTYDWTPSLYYPLQPLQSSPQLPLPAQVKARAEVLRLSIERDKQELEQLDKMLAALEG